MLQDQKNSKVRVSVLDSIFLYKMSGKVKAIIKQLDEITETMVKFNLESTDSSSSAYDHYTEQQNRMTASLVDELEIVGRDIDKSVIVEKLLMTNPSFSSPHNIPPEKISVMSIVGMGGLGKTTLAQLVYKDELIESNFELKIWVCVSASFDIFFIIKCILECITEEKCGGISNVDVLVKILHKNITGKKYLLVLDDVWNESPEDWEKLKSLLSPGARGSRILVTTRKDLVASIVGGIPPPYNLTTLSAQECWSIIKSEAFSPGGAVETPNTSCIGEEIARKCAGLPLAAAFLGSLMRLKRSERDWMKIRDNDVFSTPESPNRIIQILKLSYDNLPSHLKQCFSYCCLFPKSWKFNRKTLVRMWMAEGFILLSSGRNQTSLEDIGDGYFFCLLSNCFFQDVGKDLFGEIKTFRMHDLVHDLAHCVGSHEVTILNGTEMKSSASEIHPLCFVIEKEMLDEWITKIPSFGVA